MKRFFKRIIYLALLTAAAVAAAVYFYRNRIHPWLVSWGATEQERSQAMPGDELVRDANFATTRAVTIAASPDEVWPWLVQLGQGRGGFYSYDLLENLVGLDINSTMRIEPELQQLSIGDVIAVEPEGSGFQVQEMKPNEMLLLTLDGSGKGPVADHFRQVNAASSWVFTLTPLENNRTRLVVRWRARYPTKGSQDPTSTAVGVALEPIEFVMERKMLQGIRERAEIRTRRSVIDEYLPEFDYSEIRTVEVAASAGAVYTAAKALTGHDISGVAGSLLDSSGLPNQLQDAKTTVKAAMDQPLLEILYDKALIPLAEQPDKEIVVGVIGEFWEGGTGSWPTIESPEAYVAFDDPAYGKAAVNLLIQPGREPGNVLLSSEMRFQVQDLSKREQFGQIWPVISIGSGFVRQQWLKAIKRRAESNEDV